MRLLDHFHPPVSTRKQWAGIHSQWAAEIVRRLNGSVLPTRYECEPRVHLGTAIEIDVGTSDHGDRPPPGTNGTAGTAVQVRPQVYSPPDPTHAGAVTLAEEDVFEVQIHEVEGDGRLVAAVELVSEANKDRPAARRAFARKCGAYLQAGVSVVVVDVVTSRTANIHEQLVEEFRLPAAFDWASDTRLSAVAYRTVIREDEVRLEVWTHPLAVGAELPTVPLWVAADLAFPLELGETYAEACRSLRLA